MTLFILSDDLTGAAGVASMLGTSQAATVNLEHYRDALRDEFPCLVLNLDARERSEKEAERRMAEALTMVGESWVALRIDSALRGAVKGLVRGIASRGRLLVTDTIPEYGRATVAGKTVMGDSVKDLREKLRQIQGGLGDDWIVVADSATKADLVSLARRCVTEEMIPVDPGPLLSLVARAKLDASALETQRAGTARRAARRVAFVIGTTDETTLRQLGYMEREGYPMERPSPREPTEVRVFAFSFERDWKSVDAAFLESLRGYDALVLSGGTTANFILNKSGFELVVSGDQIQPLLSSGSIRGGLFDGKQVVLKGGFIGDEKTYKTILNWLTQI